MFAQLAPWSSPTVDYHALAPEIVLAAFLVVAIIADLLFEERQKWATSTIAGIGLLASLVPLVTLAVDSGPARSMFDGSYVVDDFSLVLKALFCIAGYVVVLMSANYVEEGGYYQGEYYALLLSSVLGMEMMASSRELVSMFVALELLSIPAYMLAAWRKRDPKSNEAGMKYFLLGVFASAVMLYGMSLLYGVSGSTRFRDIAVYIHNSGNQPIITLAVVFIIVGFGFKVSAVPFHTWAPDTYEGAPTPVTAFLSVASKAAGFVALLELLFGAFPDAKDVTQPFFWVVAAVTMTLGNLTALRQTNIVRMLAYSSVAQGGFILMPLAVIGSDTAARKDALTAVITYLLVYAAMNLGAFAVVIAVARKTRSGEIKSFGGLFEYAPGLCVLMTIFLFSLAGIPPLGGWVAKFAVFRALLSAGGGWAVALAIVGAVNSVFSLYYYANVAKEMWFNPTPDGDKAPISVPATLGAALGITTLATLVLGILPNLVLRFGDLSSLVSAASGR
ncbi:MAG: nuoN [Acidimicrobiia bacterium]|nr:nuoN [Acidimicrobiia bacterium]